MSKLTKLIKSPKSFFRDAVTKRNPTARWRPEIRKAKKSQMPTAILVGFSDWKTWIVDFLSDYNAVFMGHSPRVASELLKIIPKFPDVTVFVWSYKYPDELNDICQKHNLPMVHVEDGFIRSVGLGIEKSAPLSLAFDKGAMHFDRNKVSDLDHLLNTVDFSQDPSVLELADRVIDLVKEGVTKYIRPDGGESIKDCVYLDEGAKNILVLGQVEDDQSILHGMSKPMTGNDLVRMVAINNPTANIFYRPHPEAIARRKSHYSNPSDVKGMCQILGSRWTLNESLSIVEEVHTMTSLAGFEAAMRGLEVHTYGMPFYAGWGFTTDHDPSDVVGKRLREISLREAIAGAYILYPRYFDPIARVPVSSGRGIELASAMKTRMEYDLRNQKMMADWKQKKDEEKLDVTSEVVSKEKVGSTLRQMVGRIIRVSNRT